jgi:hypothetical protein
MKIDLADKTAIATGSTAGIGFAIGIVSPRLAQKSWSGRNRHVHRRGTRRRKPECLSWRGLRGRTQSHLRVYKEVL